MIALWLDDLRDPSRYCFPEGATPVWVKTREEFEVEFLRLVSEGTLYSVHFDNDLGRTDPGTEGRHCFNWMEEQCRENGFGPFKLFAHTSNPAARKELNTGFNSLERFWNK